MIRLLMISFSFALAFTHAGSAAAQAYRYKQIPFTVPSAFNLTVVDSHGAAVSNAQLMIGEAADTPFTGNVLTTDSEGHATLPAEWISAQPVTIEAEGFVRTTYMNLEPAVATLQLRKLDESRSRATAGQPRFELKGETTGFGQLKNDGVFDLGMVVQGIPRAAISAVSLTSMISPETDRLTVLGQSFDLPSNITIPNQTENYIFPLNFNKPAYRNYLPTTGLWQVSALHARVPFKATIDALQNGKSFVDIVNTFDFVEGSVVDANIANPTQSQNIAVNALKFTKSVPFKAPSFDSTLSLLAISLANSKGSFYPTDIKNVASNATINLTAPAGAMTNGLVLAAYRKSGGKSVGAEADQFTAVVLPNGEQRPFDPIRLVNPPRANPSQLVLDTPSVPANLNPVMTYATLNIVTSITNGKLRLETKQAQWDVWSPNWVNQLNLPNRPLPPIDSSKNQSLRWEVGFSAQFVGQKTIPPGPDALEKITHITRSAVDL